MEEAIYELLIPYKEIIGKVASIVTFGHMLSAVFILNEIRQKKSASGFSIMPFMGGLVISALGLKYGTILADDVTIKMNFVGLSLNIIFLSIFYYYTPNQEKTSVWGRLGIGFAFIIACFTYAQYEDEDLIRFRFGTLLTAVLLSLVGMPFLGIRDIIKNKSTEGLPFPMILSGTIISFMWLLYGICLRERAMINQNLLMFGMSAVQLSLFVIYPTSSSSGVKKAEAAKKSKKAKKTN